MCDLFLLVEWFLSCFPRYSLVFSPRVLRVHRRDSLLSWKNGRIGFHPKSCWYQSKVIAHLRDRGSLINIRSTPRERPRPLYGEDPPWIQDPSREDPLVDMNFTLYLSLCCSCTLWILCVWLSSGCVIGLVLECFPLWFLPVLPRVHRVLWGIPLQTWKISLHWVSPVSYGIMSHVDHVLEPLPRVF